MKGTYWQEQALKERGMMKLIDAEGVYLPFRTLQGREGENP